MAENLASEVIQASTDFDGKERGRGSYGLKTTRAAPLRDLPV